MKDDNDSLRETRTNFLENEEPSNLSKVMTFLKAAVVWIGETLAIIFKDLVGFALKLAVAFGLGTGVGALVCWYYGAPIIFSLAGGFLVLIGAVVILYDAHSL